MPRPLNGGSLSRVAGENVGVYGINQGGLGLVSSNYSQEDQRHHHAQRLRPVRQRGVVQVVRAGPDVQGLRQDAHGSD